MTPDTMRAEFEAWAKKPQPWGTGTMLLDPTTEHAGEDSNMVEIAWLAFQFAWQASAEAERGRVIEEMATILDDHVVSISRAGDQFDQNGDIYNKAAGVALAAKIIRGYGKAAALNPTAT